MSERGDKIIRENINSLDSLPEGYHPSLESKWELLEGLNQKPENRTRKLFVWLAAASVIFVLGLGWMLFRGENTRESAEMARLPMKNIAGTPHYAVEQAKKETAQDRLAAERPRFVARTLRTAGKPSQTAGEEHRITAEGEQKEIAQPTTELPLPLYTEKPKMTTEVEIVKNNAPKKQRRRFAEVDFNEPITGTPEYHQDVVQQSFIKVRLLPKPDKSQRPEVADNNPLRLKMSF